MESQRVIVITAVIALCIAVLMSGYFTRTRKQNAKKIIDSFSKDMPKVEDDIDMRSMPPPISKKKGETKSKKGSWANTMLPFYSLGILAYVVFVVGKIMSKKYSDIRRSDPVKLNWNEQRLNKGRTKTKITMHELRQLEDKLQETEKAVQEIFSRACDTMVAAQQALDSNDSSDEDMSNHVEHSDPLTSNPKELCGEATNGRRRRRIKRRERDRNKTARSHTFQDLSSESDYETSPMSNIHSHSSEGEDEAAKTPSKLTTPKEGNKELLKTAKNVKKAVSELQSYLNDQKSELYTGSG